MADNMVLTCHHVIKAADDRSIRLRFDYTEGTRETQRNGTTVPLATDWLVDFSPHSKTDLHRLDAKPGNPRTADLDFALLRLSSRPGDDRGWMRLPITSEVRPGQFLAIVQHPDGGPQQLAISDHGVEALNGNKTRIIHTINTMPGSSGSPCFNVDWTVVALHHSGEPAIAPTYNQAVPIDLISRRLRRYLPSYQEH